MTRLAVVLIASSMPTMAQSFVPPHVDLGFPGLERLHVADLVLIVDRLPVHVARGQSAGSEPARSSAKTRE